MCVQCETYSSKGYTKDCGQCGISQESSCGSCVEDWASVNHAKSYTAGNVTGDSVGRFRRCRCSALFNYDCNLWLRGTFLQRLLPLPYNCRLLQTPKETYNLNFNVVALRISSFRIPTSIFCTKELYNPGLLLFLFGSGADSRSSRSGYEGCDKSIRVADRHGRICQWRHGAHAI